MWMLALYAGCRLGAQLGLLIVLYGADLSTWLEFLATWLLGSQGLEEKGRGNHCLVEQSEHMQYLLSLTNGHISWCPQTITVTSHLPQEHTIT